MSIRTLRTVEQFAAMITADTENFELVAGELVPLSGGTPFCARIRRHLMHLIEDFFEANGLGDCYPGLDCRSAGYLGVSC